jgi:hypothetical protein
VAIVLLVSGIYFAYGQIDPCRVLAVERARRAATSVGTDLGGGLEQWTRLETSQMSTGECVGGTLDSWGERLSRHWK